MAGIEFKLDVFTGPLDLLLHLISKHQLNINDIEITKLLEQYLLYMEEAKRQDLELAGEFLEMAARLVYIKTVSL
nr:segregation/condensation protein A [Oscillospiraceae bacterium]